MQLFEHLQDLSVIAYSSPDEAMDQLRYLMTAYVKPSREYYVALCLKDPGLNPLYHCNSEALVSIILFAMPPMPFWHYHISLLPMQQLLSSHGAVVCDPH